MDEGYSTRIVPMLLQFGASPEIKSVNGRTPYDLALLENNEPVLQLFNANPNQVQKIADRHSSRAEKLEAAKK